MPKRGPLLRSLGFTAIALVLVAAASAIVGVAAATIGLVSLPAAAYGAVVSAVLLAATGVALHQEGLGLRSLALVPTRDRLRELAFGFGAGA